MAKRRAKKHVADKKLIVEAFTEMAKSKNIDKDLLQGIVEDTLSMIVRKKYGTEANFDIIVNMEKGDVEIYLMREIVDEITDPILQIAMVEAQKYSDEELEVGDEFIEEITLDNISDSFGRRLVSLASQNMNQKIREIEKDNIYKEYVQKVGEIIVGEIYQIRRNDILVTHNKVEMRLPREEQIPNEPFRYKKAQSIKTLVKEVRNTAGGSQPEIILSRAADSFLAKLFEIEIPEIYDGIIAIKSIAREPGERAKVAVQSYDDRVDPVGACVGMKGSRIHGIVRELKNENIDIINYTTNTQLLIQRSLTPAKITSMNINEETKYAEVFMKADQVSLAIGRRGVNIKLAQELTGYTIDVFRDDLEEGEFDIDLDEFADEIDAWVIDVFKKVGCDTARSILNLTDEELVRRTDLEETTIQDVKKILSVEFNDEDMFK